MATKHRLTVAANVRAELARKRLRQADVATALGISTTAAGRRLSGEVAFDVDELHALAERLGVPLAQLVDEPARAAS